MRYDVERRAELKPTMQQRILRYVESRLRELSCLVVSDYAKGVVTAALMSELTRLAALRGIPVIVDPKVEHFGYYKGVTVITPNHLEATQAAGLHGDDDQTIKEAGAIIRQRLGCQSVLITRGEKGMSLYEGRRVSWHIPAQARQVYDVTGAGDTVDRHLGPGAVDRRLDERCGDVGQSCRWYRRRHGRYRDGLAPSSSSEALGHD